MEDDYISRELALRYIGELIDRGEFTPEMVTLTIYCLPGKKEAEVAFTEQKG